MVFTGARHGSAGGGIRYFAGAMVVVLLAGLFRLSRAVGRRVDALEAAAALGEEGRGQYCGWIVCRSRLPRSRRRLSPPTIRHAQAPPGSTK
jgi:hypothetical protein